MGPHPLLGAYIALAAVSFFWGTTYLGIRIALESFPPTILIGVRFVVSGGILLLWARWKGFALPRGRQLLLIGANGVMMLGIANGCVTSAETRIPSGLTALFITTAPFWLTGVEALIPGGQKLHTPTVAAMLVGLAGVALLIAPGTSGQEISLNYLWGFLILQLGNAAWALGSIWQRRLPRTTHPVVSGAIQQLAAGATYCFASLILRPGLGNWNSKGILAMLYPIVFGSIIGYSAYMIALDRLPVAVVSIFTYVNPVVAVFLGWIVYREPFGLREATAMLIIFIGVWLVKRFAKI